MTHNPTSNRFRDPNASSSSNESETSHFNLGQDREDDKHDECGYQSSDTCDDEPKHRIGIEYFKDEDQHESRATSKEKCLRDHSTITLINSHHVQRPSRMPHRHPPRPHQRPHPGLLLPRRPHPPLRQALRNRFPTLRTRPLHIQTLHDVPAPLAQQRVVVLPSRRARHDRTIARTRFTLPP